MFIPRKLNSCCLKFLPSCYFKICNVGTFPSQLLLCIPGIINVWIRTETYWVIPEIITASYNVNKKLTPSNVWENWDILTSTSNQKHGSKAALWRQAICFTFNVQIFTSFSFLWPLHCRIHLELSFKESPKSLVTGGIRIGSKLEVVPWGKNIFRISVPYFDIAIQYQNALVINAKSP